MNKSLEDPKTKFLAAPGEMARLTRTKDWSNTPVGPVENWPQSLRTTLNILLNSKFPMFLWWGPELICFYNDAYRPSLGQDGKHPSILGIPAAEAWSEIWHIIKPLIDQVLQGGESTWSEDQLIPIFRNGKIEDVYWTFSYSPVHNESGMIAGVLVTCSETTDKVVNLNKLEESEKRFRSLAEQAPLGITILQGDDFMVEMANEMYLQIVDRTATDFIGKSLFDSLPEVKDVVYPLLKTVLHSGMPYFGTEFPVTLNRFGKNETTYFNFVYHPLKEEKDKITRIIVIATDVTAMVNAKHSIEESEKQFKLLVMQSPIPMAIFRGKDFVIELANTRMLEDLWKRTEGEVIGKELLDVFPELRDQKYPQLLAEVFISGKAHAERESVAYVQHDDGLKKFYLDFEYAPLIDVDNSISGLIITVNDVTERVEARKKLEENEKRFRLLADSMPQFVWSGDKGGKLNYFNASFYLYTGLSPEEVIKNGWLQIVHPDERDDNIETWNYAIKTGRDFSYEHRFRRKDGIYRWQLSRAVPLRDAEGEIQMWVGTSTDIHDQIEFTNELERQVQERTTALAQHVSDLAKMNKELQSFAYISSHDLQEPLRKIQLFASNIQKKEFHNLSDSGKQIFNRIQNSAERMQLLIRDLLTYSRTNTAERNFESTDLKQIIEELRDDLSEELAHTKATLEVADLCTIRVIPFQFRQLFLNLISNSLKFSNKDAPIQIQIKSEMMKGDLLTDVKLENGRDYCHISITDNGIGFETKYNEKIFELFQRLHSKDEYDGTGIGLAIVKKIVENHNGLITANSEPGKGTTFDMYIPV